LQKKKGPPYLDGDNAIRDLNGSESDRIMLIGKDRPTRDTSILVQWCVVSFRSFIFFFRCLPVEKCVFQLCCGLICCKMVKGGRRGLKRAIPTFFGLVLFCDNILFDKSLNHSSCIWLYNFYYNTHMGLTSFRG